MNMRTMAAFGLAAVTLLGAGCGGPKSRVKDGKVQAVIDQQPDKGSYFESIGIGASDPALATDTQRKATARDAAIVKAQYEMLSMIKGVQIEGGITVERALEKDSSLEARIRDTIRGAEIVKSEYTADNGCVVTMRLPRKRIEHLMGVKLN